MSNMTPVPNSLEMWKAYLVAPAATPLSFLLITQAFNISLPPIAIVIAFCASYVVAGVIGMPIAFTLRRLGHLNAWTIHGAAFVWGMLWSLFCLVAGIYIVIAIDGSISSMPLLVATIFGLMVPPVLLAATAFWGLLKQRQILLW
ncbi:MAG: hypothetical protein U0892_14045 [Pirellulales bacterium]